MLWSTFFKIHHRRYFRHFQTAQRKPNVAQNESAESGEIFKCSEFFIFFSLDLKGPT